MSWQHIWQFLNAALQRPISLKESKCWRTVINATLDLWHQTSSPGDKGLHPPRVCLKSMCTVAKAAAPLVHALDYRAQTKGETTPPRFCSLVCSYCPVGEKIKTPSLRYIHHLTSLTRVGSVRWVCGDLAGFFWSSAYSVLKRHQEKAPLIFFFYPLPPPPSLLASPKFLSGEPAGGPPCRSCFNSATQNGAGQNRLLQVEVGERNKPKKKVYRNFFPLALPGEVLQSDFAVFCQEFGLFFHEKAVPVLLPTPT